MRNKMFIGLRIAPSVNAATLHIALAILMSIFTSVVRADVPNVDARRVPDGGVHPQSRADSLGRIHLIYFKGDPLRGDIFYVRSDDGNKFTSPLRVNSQADSAIITGTIRGPHLAIGKNDRVHVAWMGSDKAEPKVGGKHAPMLYTRLNDEGDGFEPQWNVIERHPGLDGGGSVAADREGNVYVAWHAPIRQGGDEEDRQVWVNRSRDDGKTFDGEIAAVPKPTGVCGCCGMNIIAAENGLVFIVFRSATAMVNRDIHLLMSKDHATTFDIAAVDPWKIGACVMSTAAFARRGDDVMAAWETKNKIRFATLGGDDREAPPFLSVSGEGKVQKHPSIAINSRGEYVVVWTEGTGWNRGCDIVWQVFDSGGQPVSGLAGRRDGVPAWGVPAVVAGADGSFKVFY